MRIGRSLCGLLLGLLVTAGCQTYRDGQTRSIGELTDDTAIQAKVKTQLVADKVVDGLRLNVEVERGVVGLHGTVASELVRQRVLEIVGSVKGVRSIEDRLQVQDQ